MKKTILIIFVLAVFLNTNAQTTYYVDNVGTGDTLSTIAEVNALTLSAGGSVLFKRGGLWRGGNIEIDWSGTESNPIVFSDYGTGELPCLNGANIVTDWTNTSYGTDVLSGWDFTSGWTAQTNITIDNSTTFTGTSSGGIYSDYVMVDAVKYQLIIGGVAGSGGIIVYQGNTVSTRIELGTYSTTFSDTVIFTADNSTELNLYIKNIGIATTTISTLSLKIGDVWVTPSINGSTKATDVAVVIDDDRFLPVDDLADLDADLEFYAADNTGSANDSIYVYSLTDPADRTAELSAQTIGISNDGLTGTPQTDIVIKNLDFRYYGYAGIEARGTETDGNYLIDSCNFYFNKNDAVQFYNGFENNIVQNCTASYNGNGFYSNNASNNTYRYNTITNTVRYSLSAGFTDGHAIGLWDSEGCLVEYNYMALSGGNTLGCDQAAGIIRYNTIHAGNASTTAFTGLGGNVISVGDTVYWYYNVVYADSSSITSFYLNEAEGHAYVYNNTFVQLGSSNRAVRLVHGDNVTFKNNLVYNTGAVYCLEVYTDGSPVSDNNILYDTGGDVVWTYTQAYTLAEWQATGQDVNSVNSDPLFIADYTNLGLQEGSPAINAGVDVGLTEDILGNPIVGLPDIGAYEYTPVGTFKFMRNVATGEYIYTGSQFVGKTEY